MNKQQYVVLILMADKFHIGLSFWRKHNESAEKKKKHLTRYQHTSFLPSELVEQQIVIAKCTTLSLERQR